MKQSAVYTVTDYRYNKSTQKFDYLEINGEEVETSASKPEQAKQLNVTQNGIYNVTPDSGKTLSSVRVLVNVSSAPAKLHVWKTGADTYLLFPFADATTVSDLDAFKNTVCGYASAAAEYSLVKASDYTGFASLTGVTADSATSFTVTKEGGTTVTYTLGSASTVFCDLDTNIDRTIDVSTYTEPVNLTPASGKNAMIGARVTLTNIPSGGSTLYAWTSTQSDLSPSYFSFSTAPASATGEKGIFHDMNEDAIVVREITAEDDYVKSSDTVFSLGSAAASFTRDSTKDIVW